jgi:hypothetical protein
LVERQLPKLNVEGSSPFTRFASRDATMRPESNARIPP